MMLHTIFRKCVATTSKTMLYAISIKCVEHQKQWYTQLTKNVYNIENNVIHKCHKLCTTSKTMLFVYTIVRSRN